MALDYNHAARFPIVLSLVKLHLRSLWYILQGGQQPSFILWGDDAETEGWWPKLWRSSGDESTTGGHKIVDVDDEDPIQRARDIRDAAVGIGDDDEDPGDDYFDGMTRRRHGPGGGGGAGRDGDRGVMDAELEELEDDWELVVLALLAVGIGGLIVLRRYYEQRRLDALDRLERERQRQQQQQQGGLENDQQQEQHPPPPAPEQRLNEPLQNMGLFM